MAKYEKWCEQLEKDLAEPFPQEIVQQKSKGGTSISFVAWHHYVWRLNNLVGGGWSMSEPLVKEVAGKLVMGVSVTILGVTRVNFGDEDEDKDNYGTACTNAWAQAFKRTCALFGIGLYMYDKTGTVQQKPTPKAASKAQVDEIALLADKHDVPKDKAGGLSNKLNEGMTEDEAKATIKWLKSLPVLQGA